LRSDMPQSGMLWGMLGYLGLGLPSCSAFSRERRRPVGPALPGQCFIDHRETAPITR
jgi:hypothetical protein